MKTSTAHQFGDRVFIRRKKEVNAIKEIENAKESLQEQFK